MKAVLLPVALDAVKFRDTARLMLRPLLADRFKLVVRRERRELPVYALVVAKPRELGPQLQHDNEHDCATPRPPVPPAPRPPTAQGPAPPPLMLPCGADIFVSGYVAARALALSYLALTVTRFADRVVLDETGLTGKFDWEIRWVPDDVAVRSTNPIDGPSLLSAFRDQAGLKLESKRSQVDVLVVEHVDHPEPD